LDSLYGRILGANRGDQPVLRESTPESSRSACMADCRMSRVAPLTMISDHVSLLLMETIPVSKFKATCLAVLQRVKRTGRPVLVTRFGQPVAAVVRPERSASGADWLGAMSGRASITGDVVGPATGPRDWAALRR